jgi:GNAT superfamily N-acetyltransferase
MNTLTVAELEKLIAHETHYFEIWSQVTQMPHVWFLDGLSIPDYHSANRALRLRAANEAQRTHGSDSIIGANIASVESESVASESIESIVAETIAHFRGRGLPVVVDVDPVAEEQGFGRELRRRGVTPVIGSTLLMRYGTNSPPVLKSTGGENTGLRIERAANETGAGEAREWISLAGSDEDDAEESAFWRTVADAEARSPTCRLYLAHMDGQAVGACQLFSHAGWAQIDSVITHSDFRRRGVASRLVAQAVHDSLTLGNTTTYLFTDNGGAGEQVYRRLGFEVWGVNVLRRHIQW